MSHASPRPLGRSMSTVGALFLALSAATPASSVFVILPEVLSAAGTGALWAMAAAALIAVGMAQVYAELASAFPHAGGEYAIVSRLLGPAPGFATLALNLANSLTGTAVLALGVSGYLDAFLPGAPERGVALAVVGIATGCALFDIRTNAWLTGGFVAVELLALAVLTGLGFAQPERGVGELLAHPLVMSGGEVSPLTIGAFGAAAASAIFAYDGYGAAVYFGEELHAARRRIGRAIVWALAITVAAEAVPLVAVLVGAPDLGVLLSGEDPLSGFVAARGGSLLARGMDAAVALAIVNAVIAMVLLSSRQLYATARDGVWGGRVDAAFTRLHPRFRSPWAATLTAGGAIALLCLLDLRLLLIATGTGAGIIYCLLCVALLVGRRTGRTAATHWRMPAAPLCTGVTLLAILGVLAADASDPEGRPGLLTAALSAGLGLGWYALVVRRQSGFALRAPPPEPDP